MRRARVRVSRDQVGFLRFLLEGYNGLATTETVDRSVSIVDLHVPAERAAELEALLGSVAAELGITGVEWVAG